MEMKFCQSCGMPLSPEVLGTNADGSKNEEYCIYCYKNTGKSLSREEYEAELRKYFPMLKRWKKA